MPTFFSDYIRCLRSTGSINNFGDPNRRQGVKRKIEIENLNGNIVECTLWDEMANHFGEADIASMEQPMIITISSCRVSKYTDYQLSASSATYYYLNPKIPEAEELRALFKARYENTPLLTIYKYPHTDIQQDKTRNRLPLKTIIDENPQSYKAYDLRLKQLLLASTGTKIGTTSLATNAAKQQ
ncbi:nucleic acid-binding, OB-fold protein [Tanacetum coccineum]